ncbi:MAG: 7TM diverse intracellular signaling domain-containing protein [Flavobacteriales bacterium]
MQPFLKSTFWCLIFSLLNCLPLFSSEHLPFEISFYEDVESIESFESISTKSFTKVKDPIISLGIKKSTVWVKLKLNKEALEKQSVLVVDRPFLDEVVILYNTKDKGIVQDSLGMKYPLSTHKLNYHNPAFEINTETMESSYVYLRVRSRWSMLIPVSIISKKDFNNNRPTESFIGGILIGGLLVMAIYNLFLFFSTRDSNYLIYVCGLIGAILSQGYIFGLLIPILSPNIPEFTFSFPVYIMAITGIFNCWFALKFLEIKTTSSFFYRLLLFSICFGGLSIALESISLIFEISDLLYISRKVNILNVLLLSAVILSSAISSLIKGKKVAIFFTIAWTFYLSGMFVFALKTVGILPHNGFTSHFMHFGTFLECMLLSFALGHKYSLVRIEKERLEKQTRAELEKLVKQQTAQLEISLEEKEILLKEIHHRVKNNLQIVISLLDLQVASIKDSANKEILAQSKSRVYSMSLIHQKLYQSDNMARINMNDYLEELFTFVKNSYFTPDSTIHFGFDVHSKELSITQAVPLGLIVNELLTNSFKYGMQKDSVNTISLSLHFLKETLELKIFDSGTGFEKQEDHQNVRKSLGLFLVKSLTKQLRGQLSRTQNERGFTTQITIPKEIIYEK